MNSSELMTNKISKYLFFICLVAKELNTRKFNFEIAFKELCIKKEDDMKFISDTYKNFNQSSKTNVNYLTFMAGDNIIPLDIFEILQRSDYFLDNNKSYMVYKNINDKNIFDIWKSVHSINKDIYDSEHSLVKTMIAKEISKESIVENQKGNKSTLFCQDGTRSVATKQYSYTDSNGDLTTIFNNKKYIEFYDIFDRDKKILHSIDICVKNILDKICKNDIIMKLTNNNITILEEEIEHRVKRFLIRG